jgi:hypothetical protein
MLLQAAKGRIGAELALRCRLVTAVTALHGSAHGLLPAQSRSADSLPLAWNPDRAGGVMGV